MRYFILLLLSLHLCANDPFHIPKQDQKNLRIEQELDLSLPNILIIGDSISIGYHKDLVTLMSGKANIFRPKTNCGDSNKGLQQIDKWLGKSKWDIIHFNFGLHDLCYRHPDAKVYGNRDKINGTISVSLDQYKKNLQLIINRLKKTNAKLIWGSTTFVPEAEAGRFQKDNIRYNVAASEVMLENDILINDLFTTSKNFPEKLTNKGDVHFKPKGSQKLAIQVVNTIKTLLPTQSNKVQASQKKFSSPNVILFLVDDLGWNDIACYGSSFYETPNLDQLAKDGFLFTDAYAANPVCSPTRASILLGKYPSRVGLSNHSGSSGPKGPSHKLIPAKVKGNMPLEDITLAEALKEANYTTAHIGKWHLQAHYDTSQDHFPDKHGFDINIAGHRMGQPGSFYFPYKSKQHPSTNVPNMSDGKDGDYLTDQLTNKAIDFIKDHKDKPFFLNFWYYTVHTPIIPRQDLKKKYEQKAKMLGLDLKATGTPVLKSVSRSTQNNPSYAAMVEAMDENIGRVLSTLKELNIEDETIIIFCSDNGGLSTGTGPNAPTSLLPLKAGKAWVYEGGIRIPFIIKWPGNPGGKSLSTPVCTTDIYPTILNMLKLPLKPKQHVDGVSLTSIMTGSTKELKREAIYIHYPHYHHINSMGPAGAIRMGDYKLVEYYETGEVELYNLHEDIGEMTNLVSEQPERSAKMLKKLEEWRKESNSPKPELNPNYETIKDYRKPKFL
ncbi:sulfatase-like hydrolase/transferase [Lentisphaera profundi]|uniref:Sulfatase-like hydrolase/transferase n=1 Tax=Lentisphaera profundi TaxID=1658616 RepID=A0ABY7VUN4_9BACT|nr:sulfatase-like hydrolase/transferase [Lentisphaera profundi]WDE97606.1 sulfatase-like hydrolase/transferase [Lentisphaera profundi]